MTGNQAAIGGYLGLEMPAAQGEWYPQARRFQSGRAAFLALLLARRPARVWLPWYICESMLEPVQMAGIGLARYAVDDSLRIRGDIVLGPDDWLLYVNYFGVCSTQVDEILAQYPRHQVVIDNSQAFFSAPRDCLATIYSPRKFFGIADGGYLLTDAAIPGPVEVDESLGRCWHLLKRLGGEPEDGYADYGRSEASLSRQMPRQMSHLTRCMLERIDYIGSLKKRTDNFSLLHHALGAANRLPICLETAVAPLCYPFLADLPGLRQMLINHRVFVPIYWPNLYKNPGDLPAFENDLVQSCLPLPCDQRYGADEMNRMLVLLNAMRGKK